MKRLLPFVLALVPLSCDAGELTRSKAAALIEKHSTFAEDTPEIVIAPVVESIDAMKKDGIFAQPGRNWSLSEKGLKLFKECPFDVKGRPSCILQAPLRRQLGKISGITNRSGLKAVEFTFGYVAVAPELGRYSPIAAIPGVAFFRLYDDGWRIEKVDSQYFAYP